MESGYVQVFDALTIGSSQSQVVADCQTKLAEAQDQWLDARRKEVLESAEKRFNEYRREEERALQKVLG